jgi:hypothetical protein
MFFIINYSAIAAISFESDEKVTRDRVDLVFNDAIRWSIVLRGINNYFQFETETAQDDIEVDLSGLTFPVARAACRYVLGRLCNTTGKSRNVTFITGTGASHTKGGTTISLSLRDYVQEILISDFVPPVNSVVEEEEQRKVKIIASTLCSWIDKQRPILD